MNYDLILLHNRKIISKIENAFKVAEFYLLCNRKQITMPITIVEVIYSQND